MPQNSLPKLLDTLRPTLTEIAKWADVSRGMANFWREKKYQYQPKPKNRARLVKAVRQHAARLLDLADAVEREGKALTSKRS